MPKYRVVITIPDIDAGNVCEAADLAQKAIANQEYPFFAEVTDQNDYSIVRLATKEEPVS